MSALDDAMAEVRRLRIAIAQKDALLADREKQIEAMWKTINGSGTVKGFPVDAMRRREWKPV